MYSHTTGGETGCDEGVHAVQGASKRTYAQKYRARAKVTCTGKEKEKRALGGAREQAGNVRGGRGRAIDAILAVFPIFPYLCIDRLEPTVGALGDLDGDRDRRFAGANCVASTVRARGKSDGENGDENRPPCIYGEGRERVGTCTARVTQT